MEIDINKIKILRNTRTDLDKLDLSELMEDIRENGLLHPIGVWQENDEYILAFGHRRFMALKKLGRKSLVVGKDIKILDGILSSEDFLILNLSENLHRVDNTPLELAKGIKELLERGLNKSEISVRLSIPKHKIETALQLLSHVPEEYKKQIGYVANYQKRKGKISATVGEKISTLRVSNEIINKIWQIAKEEELTVKDINLYSKLLHDERCSFEEARKLKDLYCIYQVSLIFNKKELEKYKEKVKENKREIIIKKIIKGEFKPDPRLLY